MADEKKDSRSADERRGAVAEDSGEAEVQAKVDEAEAKGYFGQEVDKTPRENYTLEGVIAGAPTPETDPEQRLAVSPRHVLSEQ
jgi:hypothetical protein